MKKLTMALLTGLTFSSTLFSATLSNEIKNSSLVVYNSNLGLVHEERELSLHQSDTSIIYKGVASSVQTDSINVEISPDVTLYSQQYRFDSLTQSKLLQAHIGKKVEVRLLRNKNEFKLISATLLAFNGQKSIVKTLDYKIITVKNDNIIFDSIPDTLITKPSLVWNIKSKKDVKTTMKLDYLISNINFKSNYILNIDEDKASLVGWISVNNRSGKRFENTKLSLLAGDIQQKPVQIERVYKTMRVMSNAQRVVEKSFEGYHFYAIPFNITLANNETTQIKFLQENNISIQRLYSTTLSNPLYLQGEQKSDVSQFIAFNGVSMPLPKGDIRIYSQLEGQTILLGENAISHTPKNTDIKLRTGTNFDLKVVQKTTKRESNDEWFNVDVEYSVSNNSDTNKTVEILVPFNTHTDSKVDTNETYTFTKGNLVTFSVKIKANANKKFNVNYESKK
ncbi:hypothetical protein JHD49_09790 [Sulfurimonas sp. SAG-AH-194-C21]|nr:hypothetical protein [Sulfurimonas sp. SAG-AH-194-C21]MDF1884232.1 hypothetical protein [Sulfurimonas sp. SAG-AH-194-C21]